MRVDCSTGFPCFKRIVPVRRQARKQNVVMHMRLLDRQAVARGDPWAFPSSSNICGVVCFRLETYDLFIAFFVSSVPGACAQVLYHPRTNMLCVSVATPFSLRRSY